MLNNLKIIKHRPIEESKILLKTPINKNSTRPICSAINLNPKNCIIGNNASAKLRDVSLLEIHTTTQTQIYRWLECGKIKHLESLVLRGKADLIIEALKNFPNCIHLKTKEFLNTLTEYKVI